MKKKRLGPGQLTPAQLGDLARQLPGASPEEARRLKDRIVRGIYGRSPSDKLVLVDAFTPADVDRKIIFHTGAFIRKFEVARVFKSTDGEYCLVTRHTGQRDQHYRVEPANGRWAFWGGVLMLSESYMNNVRAGFLDQIPNRPPGFFPVDAGDPMVSLANSAVPGFNETLPSLALRVFGDADFARKWMRVPCNGLGGRVPAKMIRSKNGRAEVKAFLIGVGAGNFQ